MLDEEIRQQFGTKLDSVHKKFMVLTDGASVIGKIAGSSIIRHLVQPNER